MASRDRDQLASENASGTTAARPTQVQALLGELEAMIMVHCWTVAEAAGALDGAAQTVAEVHQALAALGRRSAYTTVMTVMGRLVEKGLLYRDDGLGRSGPGSGYHYWPAQSEATFIAHASHQRVSALIATFGDVALAQFADALNMLDPERLAALMQLGQSGYVTQPMDPADDAGGRSESGRHTPDRAGREDSHEP